MPCGRKDGRAAAEPRPPRATATGTRQAASQSPAQPANPGSPRIAARWSPCPDVRKRRPELFPGTDSEFSEHLAQMPLHGARAQEELGGDLRVGLPADGQARDLH